MNFDHPRVAKILDAGMAVVEARISDLSDEMRGRLREFLGTWLHVDVVMERDDFDRDASLPPRPEPLPYQSIEIPNEDPLKLASDLDADWVQYIQYGGESLRKLRSKLVSYIHILMPRIMKAVAEPDLLNSYVAPLFVQVAQLRTYYEHMSPGFLRSFREDDDVRHRLGVLGCWNDEGTCIIYDIEEYDRGLSPLTSGAVFIMVIQEVEKRILELPMSTSVEFKHHIEELVTSMCRLEMLLEMEKLVAPSLRVAEA